MLKYAYTIMYVNDVAGSIAFYEKAFGFTKKFIGEEGDYGELLSGETTISFASLELGEQNVEGKLVASQNDSAPFAIELSFTTTSIDEDFKKALYNGAILVKEITEKPWGQRVGYLRDNNGFLIEICTPMS